MKKISFMLAFILCFCCLVPISFAAEVEIPSFEAELEPYKNYYHTIAVAKNENGITRLYILYDKYNFHNNGAEFIATKMSNQTVKYELKENGTSRSISFAYWSLNGNEWKNKNEVNDYYEAGIDFTTPVYSDIDIYNEDGTLFFPKTSTKMELYQIIQTKVAETLPTTQMTLVGAMKTLTLCGVGLVALLMGLNLLYRVLRNYLPR